MYIPLIPLAMVVLILVTMVRKQIPPKWYDRVVYFLAGVVLLDFYIF